MLAWPWRWNLPHVTGLPSFLPTGSNLSLTAVHVDVVNIQYVRLSICIAVVIAPDRTTHLRRQPSGGLGSPKPLCGVIWRTYPKGLQPGPLRPRNNPSYSSSCGGRDGRPDIPHRVVAGGRDVGKVRGANHRRLCSGEFRNTDLVSTSPSLLTRTNGTYDLTFFPSCRFHASIEIEIETETFDSVGIGIGGGGMIRITT